MIISFFKILSNRSSSMWPELTKFRLFHTTGKWCVLAFEYRKHSEGRTNIKSSKWRYSWV